MFRIRFSPWVILFLLVWASPGLTQSILMEGSTGSSAPKESYPPDPLGRQTPRGTVLGFIKNAQAGDYHVAQEYLQLAGLKGKLQGEELASQLQVLIDRTFQGRISEISENPMGALDDDQDPNREVAGVFRINGTEVNLELVRIRHDNFGLIWLISRNTLQRVPALYDQVGLPGIERILPVFLVQRQIFGATLWQWIAWLLSFPLALGISWLLVRAVDPFRRLLRGKKSSPSLEGTQKPFRLPTQVFLTLVIHGIAVRLIAVPMLYRYYYFRFLKIFLIFAIGWLAWVIIDRVFIRIRERAGNRMSEAAASESLLVLGRRIVRACLIIVVFLAILPLLGINPMTAIAGLGIGGLVVALAAQKTLENLFGGVSLLMDRVIRVGDVCKIGDQVGKVEDIGLRSIRIRTVAQTELSVPNGALAQIQFENLTRRSKINLTTSLGLRYETSAEQLRRVLTDTQRLLELHPRVETGTSRVRFARFGPSALELELFAYITTADVPEFMSIREDLLLRIMDIVLASGTGFAFPSNTVYLSEDKGIASEKAEAIRQRVEEWRQKQEPVSQDPTFGQLKNSGN
ncbi:MAG: mechanosensitive ion channel family protein [Terriglobia bacterium]